ncbi:MAG: hypothetical protein GY853_01540 [PVC group bacterium]|nr:hypothetical protein [PVC group bacterium]
MISLAFTSVLVLGMLSILGILEKVYVWYKRRKYTDEWFDHVVNDYAYMTRKNSIERIINDI